MSGFLKALGIALVGIIAGWVAATLYPKAIGVPELIWSGLFASVVTIIGVLIANVDNTRRLRIQLSADEFENAKRRSAEELENAKERKVGVRREVYLKAAEQLPIAMGTMSRLPQSNPATEDVSEGVMGFFSAVAQVQLVGTVDAASKVTLLSTELRGQFFRFMAQAMPIHTLNQEIERLNGRFQRSIADRDGAIARLQQLKGGAEAPPLVAVMERAQGEVDTLADELEKAHNRSNELQIKFVEELVGERARLSNLLYPAILAIRQELEADGDADEFLKALKADEEAGPRQLAQFLSDLKGHFGSEGDEGKAV